MAAKKAATKSRTSGNNSTSKMKWWYLIPVLLIVAVAGYAIVRFSEAGSQFGVVTSSKIKGAGQYVKKNNVQYKVLNTPGTAQADYSGNTIGKAKKVCANVYFKNLNGSRGTAKLDLIAPRTGKTMATTGRVSKADGTTAQLCVNNPIDQQGDYAPPVNVRLYSYGGGTVSVSKFYLLP